MSDMNAQALGPGFACLEEEKKISSVLSPQHAGNQQASFQEVLEAVPGLVSHALTIVARSGK